jgi:LysR family transcriptional regulator, transcriptional activator of nhaA
MSQKPLNYRHLHYFWVVAKEGSVTAAAQRLGLTAQTVSAQLAALERELGRALLAPQGRRLGLTEAGRLVMGFADQIFLLGEQMEESLRQGEGEGGPRLILGVSDGVPKLIAYRLLEVVTQLPRPVRLRCYEGKFEQLLADLALHKLDLVLADRPVSPGSSLRLFSHPLGESPTLLYGTPALAERYRPGFPASLHGAPLLLPTRNNALRARLEQWLEARNLRPRILGEFEDSALLDTFGRTGLGLFPGPEVLQREMAEQFGALPVGGVEGVHEHFYAISGERRIQHPAVEAILQTREHLLHPEA